MQETSRQTLQGISPELRFPDFQIVISKKIVYLETLESQYVTLYLHVYRVRSMTKAWFWQMTKIGVYFLVLQQGFLTKCEGEELGMEFNCDTNVCSCVCVCGVGSSAPTIFTIVSTTHVCAHV